MMKSLFLNIMSFLAAAVPLLLPTSCTENIPAAPLLSASLEVKPMQDASKSASSVTETTEDAVRNWNLLVFDRGVLAAMYYRDCRYDFFDSEAFPSYLTDPTIGLPWPMSAIWPICRSSGVPSAC